MSKYYCKDCGDFPLYGREMCKPCYFKWYYQENKERLLAYSNNWAKNNPEIVKANNKKFRDHPEFKTYMRAYMRRRRANEPS